MKMRDRDRLNLERDWGLKQVLKINGKDVVFKQTLLFPELEQRIQDALEKKLDKKEKNREEAKLDRQKEKEKKLKAEVEAD